MAQLPGPSEDVPRRESRSVALSDEQARTLKTLLLEAVEHADPGSDLGATVRELLTHLDQRYITQADFELFDEREFEILDGVLSGVLHQLGGASNLVIESELEPRQRRELLRRFEQCRQLVVSASVIGQSIDSLADGSDPEEAFDFIAAQLERSRAFIANAGADFDEPAAGDDRALLEEDDEEPEFGLSALREWNDHSERNEEENGFSLPELNDWDPLETKIEALITDLREHNVDESRVEILLQNSEEISLALIMAAEDALESMVPALEGSPAGDGERIVLAIEEILQRLARYQAVGDGDFDFDLD